MLKRFKNLFSTIDPSREEFYIATMLAVVSLVNINVEDITTWPNYVYALTIVWCVAQVVFVLKSCADEPTRWDTYQFFGGLVIDLQVFFYAAYYYYEGDMTGAVIFACSTLVSIYCSAQAGRRSLKRDMYIRNHARRGEVIWSKE